MALVLAYIDTGIPSHPRRRAVRRSALDLRTILVTDAGFKVMAERAHNLPTQPTRLIGREHDIRAVLDLIGRDEVRLLTLTGPGGTGKTRVGLEVAAELLERFDDGAFFVDLAPLRDPSMVLPTVA